MIRFPPAKINLGLHIVGKRSDGYHDLRTIMVPIPLTDVLEVIIDPNLADGAIHYKRTGLPIPGEPQMDLCIKAIELFRRRSPVPGCRVHLHKVIPMGAGLGGGSSDGANMLIMLSELLADASHGTSLPLLAASLGSDCTFFLNGSPQLAEGRGEKTRPISIPHLTGKWLVVVYPNLPISTADVFRSFSLAGKDRDLLQVISNPVSTWQNELENELESVVFPRFPAIARIKSDLIRAGAEYASMSGSGSTVFGIFDQRPTDLLMPRDQQHWILRL